MSMVTLQDGAQIFYRDWGAGSTVLFRSAPHAAKLVDHATLTIYPGAPHGLADTHKDRLNADLPEIIKS